MKRVFKSPRMVHIKWKDHFSMYDSWGPTEAFLGEDQKTYMVCQTAGFLVAENKDSWFVSLNYCDENNTSADSVCILKCAVIKKKFLK